MKVIASGSIRAASVALIIAVALIASANGQTTTGSSTTAITTTGDGGRLDIDNLDRLAAKAAQVVNVNLDERLLQLIPKVISDKDPDEAKIKEIIGGLRGVYVRSFEFDAEGAYDTNSDVAPLRQQLRTPGWSRIVEVSSTKERKSVEVYVLNNGSRVDGLTVLAFEPKQLTVVNIVGTIDLEKLSKLEGQFGIPELEIKRNDKREKK